MIYSSELDRGFDIYELTPSAQLSANEIAAAKLVTMKEYNPQSQPKLVWPAAFPVVRSYLDQLVRNDGLATDKTSAIAKALTRPRSRGCGARRGAHEARRAGGRRREGREGLGAREDDGVGDQSTCGGIEVAARTSDSTQRNERRPDPGAFRPYS